MNALALVPPTLPTKHVGPLPCCQGCLKPLRELHGYADVDPSVRGVLGGVIACQMHTMTLVSVGGDPVILERLAEARRGTQPPALTLREVEARHIRKTLARTATVKDAAAVLGVHRTTLVEKIKRYRKAGLL